VLKRLSRLPGLGRVRGLRQRRAARAEVDELLCVARASFVQMQAAWDRADLHALGRLATGPLLEELRCQLQERGPAQNHTEVVSLQARLLSMDDLCEAQVASVEFSGLIQEDPETAAAPFRELWLLANVKAADHGWRLARVQALA
jgi:predicted lipid-binding transport protein (Tim44 family)